jgi:alkaline phosphatase
MGLRARASSCIIEAVINKADASDSRTLVIVTSDHGCVGVAYLAATPLWFP